MKKLLTTLAVSGALAASANAATVSIGDPGFEAWPGTTFQGAGAGLSVGDWTLVQTNGPFFGMLNQADFGKIVVANPSTSSGTITQSGITLPSVLAAGDTFVVDYDFFVAPGAAATFTLGTLVGTFTPNVGSPITLVQGSDVAINPDNIGATSGTLSFVMNAGTGRQSAFDNVTLDLNSIPEPSSTALVGLAGLGLLLRRRK